MIKESEATAKIKKVNLRDAKKEDTLVVSIEGTPGTKTKGALGCMKANDGHRSSGKSQQVQNESFYLKKGEILGLFDKSGSGKSALITVKYKEKYLIVSPN